MHKRNELGKNEGGKMKNIAAAGLREKRREGQTQAEAGIKNVGKV